MGRQKIMWQSAPQGNVGLRSRTSTERGLPDISLLEPLAAALGVSVAELLSGECVTNANRSGNLLRWKFYDGHIYKNPLL